MILQMLVLLQLGNTVTAGTVLPTVSGNIVFNCSFDSDLCGFVQSHNDTFDWTINSGGTPSIGTGPSHDVSGNGKYAYIEATIMSQGDNAKLVKGGLSFSTKKCLSFYYHMYGATIGTLNVYVGQKKIFTKSGDQGNRWQQATVYVTDSVASELLFEGIRGRSYTGDIAIDNVVLQDCSGGGGGGRCPYECSFDQSMCYFVQDQNDVFDWTRRNGSTPSYGTGPSGDHTGNGSYMYIETSYYRQGDNAKLNSPKLQFGGNMCLTFYYHMYGSTIGTLNVIINGNNVFTASGDKGNNWLGAAVDVRLWGIHAVVFEGIRGSSYQGDIAIDDFRLAPGSCPTAPPATSIPTIPQVFRCTFDQSMCGFVQYTNDIFNWTRNRGRTPSSSTGPNYDHTTGNGYYMYIETSSPRVQGDNAILVSPKLLFSGKNCLEFHYHMYGASMGTLNVFFNGARVFSVCKDKGNRWIKAEIRLDVSSPGMYEVTFEGIRGSSFRSDIAIDDFLLAPGSCSLSG